MYKTHRLSIRPSGPPPPPGPLPAAAHVISASCEEFFRFIGPLGYNFISCLWRRKKFAPPIRPPAITVPPSARAPAARADPISEVAPPAEPIAACASFVCRARAAPPRLL
ncbi:hypothetical protein EVAR_10767_1 [Eumeta japonica]|uniref:Uncharacterized protein n=1 Tax=Eumeta variegata TaxID=151549 RepID=A0A4C1W8G3_EUMVA|nr:hypothetical protein EVAR_10767_1 [Eumeta japonica]